MTIEKAIKRLENIRNDAQAVLDTGFGNKPSESNITYVNNKEMAELAISALKRHTPQRIRDYFRCPLCDTYNETIEKRKNTVTHDVCYCWHCGQALEFWDDEKE